MAGESHWHAQGDYQVGYVGGKAVVLARGSTFTSHTKRELLPLWVMASCKDLDAARRIVDALVADTSTEGGES